MDEVEREQAQQIAELQAKVEELKAELTLP
jgi:hypothetical protein